MINRIDATWWAVAFASAFIASLIWWFCPPLPHKGECINYEMQFVPEHKVKSGHEHWRPWVTVPDEIIGNCTKWEK